MVRAPQKGCGVALTRLWAGCDCRGGREEGEGCGPSWERRAALRPFARVLSAAAGLGEGRGGWAAGRAEGAEKRTRDSVRRKPAQTPACPRAQEAGGWARERRELGSHQPVLRPRPTHEAGPPAASMPDHLRRRQYLHPQSRPNCRRSVPFLQFLAVFCPSTLPGL